MKTRLVQIGRSVGVRLPRVLLEEAELYDEVEVRARKGSIVIQRVGRPRSGWAKAARRLRGEGSQGLIDPPTSTRFERDDWRW